MSATTMTTPLPDGDTNPSPFHGVGFVAVGLVAILSMLLGIGGTLAVQHITRPLPQALVAEVSHSGDVACATGDRLVRTAINDGDAQEVKNGQLAAAEGLSVTATAAFNATGHAENLVIRAKATNGGMAPVITAVHVWTVQVANKAGERTNTRYVAPAGAGAVALQDTKVAPNQASLVFICVATEPR